MKKKELILFNQNQNYLDMKVSKCKKFKNLKIKIANQNQIHFFKFKNKKLTILKNQDKLINICNSNKIFKVI